MRRVLVLSVLFALCACGGAESPAVWNVADGQEMSLAEAARDFPSGGMVLVGERHDSEAHHQAQLTVIKAARSAQKRVAVGLEMIQAREQAALDAWVAGTLSETDMREVFVRNWGNSWELYEPIFEYCREHSIPMVGLNVPRFITRKVARQGFSSLTDEERGQLPPVACVLDPDYAAQLQALLGPHGQEGEMYERFCEAQLVWDTAMAFYGLQYLQAHPDSTLVVLAGYIHAWKKAVPYQVNRLGPGTPAISLLPETPGRLDRRSASVQDADYLLLDLE